VKYTKEFLAGGTELLRKVSVDIPENPWGSVKGLHTQLYVLYEPAAEPEDVEEEDGPTYRFKRLVRKKDERASGLRHRVWDPIPVDTDINLRQPKDPTSHLGTKWTLTPAKGGARRTSSPGTARGGRLR